MTLNEHRSEGFLVSVIKYMKSREGCFFKSIQLVLFVLQAVDIAMDCTTSHPSILQDVVVTQVTK
jgi:hypothetical protein